jgi:imidazolonepropionase-like amidohydrolase
VSSSGVLATLVPVGVCATLVLLLASCAATEQGVPGGGALIGGTLVDGTGAAPVPDAVVVFQEGRITCAGAATDCSVPAGASVTDVTGRWIVPGLVDGHVHYSQTGWADGRPDQAADLRAEYPYEAAMALNRSNPGRYFRSYLCSGVTATWDVGGYPWTWDLRAAAEDDPWAPHVSAAGPLLSARDHWLNVPAERQFLYLSDAESVEAAARYLVRSNTDQVKVWYLVEEDAPDAAHYQEMLRIGARVAREAGTPLIVHATGLWQAKDALRAGAVHLVHSVYDQDVDEEFIELALANGASYNPTLTVSEGVGQFAERAFDESALDVACVDPGTLEKARRTAAVPGRAPPETLARRREAGRARYELMLRNLRTVHEAGIPVVMGTDAGNTLTLHGPSAHVEMEAMQEAGMSPMDVLIAATLNAATAMGRGDDLGTVTAGKIADMIVVGADPTADVANLRSPALVVRAGHVHAREELVWR